MVLISHCPPANIHALSKHGRYIYSLNTPIVQVCFIISTLESGNLLINTLPRVTYLAKDGPTCKLIWVFSELLGSEPWLWQP